MKLTKESIENIVKEELDKFLESNPQFSKMMKQHAQSDASRAFKPDDEEQRRAEKAKQFRQAQRGASGARNLELNEVGAGDVVWLVVLGYYREVDGVFSSREAAENHVQKMGFNDLEIQAWKIDGGQIEEQSKFPQTTPPKTSGKSSKMISNAVNTAKDKKKGEQK